MSSRKALFSKEDLIREYTELGKTTTQIANESGHSPSAVWNYMKLYDIPRRPEWSYRVGKKFSPEWRNSLSKARIAKQLAKGKANPNWRGGVAIRNNTARITEGYQVWRKGILRFKGDICTLCGKNLLSPCPCCGKKPDRHVHHLAPFADNPTSRMSDENVVVLCDYCHKLQHGKGH